MTIGISAIPSYISWSNARRFGRMLPYYLCDGSIVQQEALEKIVRGTKDVATGKYVGGTGYKNLGSALRKSFLKTETAYKSVLAKEGSFWKYAGKTLRGLPSEISMAWNEGGTIAKAVGKSSFWGSVKGAGSALGKRIPLVGSLIYAATEIPNIARATADGGLISGAAETAKAIGRMTGFTAGAAIGQVLIPIPFVGGIIGGMLGEKLASLATGKSYSEQKEKIQNEAIADAGAKAENQYGTPSPNAEVQGAAEEFVVENPFGGTLTNKQLAELQRIQNEIIKGDNSTFNVSA